MAVIKEVVQSFEPAFSSGEPFPLINGLAGIHIAYSLMEKEVFWLAELSDVFPEVPKNIIEKNPLSSGQPVKYTPSRLTICVHIITIDLSS